MGFVWRAMGQGGGQEIARCMAGILIAMPGSRALRASGNDGAL
jgi:hypothetical protein